MLHSGKKSFQKWTFSSGLDLFRSSLFKKSRGFRSPSEAILNDFISFQHKLNIDAYTKQQKPLSSERSSCPVNSAVVHSLNNRLKQFVLFGKQWKKKSLQKWRFSFELDCFRTSLFKISIARFQVFQWSCLKWFYNISAQVELMRTQTNKNRSS